jgi:hypothetical protein
MLMQNPTHWLKTGRDPTVLISKNKYATATAIGVAAEISASLLLAPRIHGRSRVPHSRGGLNMIC